MEERKKELKIHKDKYNIDTYFLPQRLSGGQTGACRHEPAVTQLSLVEIMCADAVYKQVRVLTQLLNPKRQETIINHEDSGLKWCWGNLVQLPYWMREFL